MAESIYAVKHREDGRGNKSHAISEYEHLEELVTTEEKLGEVPSKRKGNGHLNSAEADGVSALKLWRTRRRRDGKTFLAMEFLDTFDIMDVTKKTLLGLLNHQNLVSLIDIIQDTDIQATSKNYTVWEDCNRGTLNRLLWNDSDQERLEIPESLCWHVLDGISQALLWLHQGHKHTFPFDQQLGHNDDWHPVLIMEISPTNIYFTEPEGIETYGDVKLGCFQSASISSTPIFAEALKPQHLLAESVYLAPEIRLNKHGFSKAADIWSLGAVLYQMMVGTPPSQLDLSKEVQPFNKSDFWTNALPRRYSEEAKNLVRQMLQLEPDKRPTADDLSSRVNSGMNMWRDSTLEGRYFIAKGEDRRIDLPG